MKLPVGGELVAPAGEYLVGIRLMAYVPDKAVVRCVEHIMESHCQLHDS